MTFRCPLCHGRHRSFVCPAAPIRPPMHYGAGDGVTVFVEPDPCPPHGLERPSDADGDRPSEDAAAALSPPDGAAATNPQDDDA